MLHPDFFPPLFVGWVVFFKKKSCMLPCSRQPCSAWTWGSSPSVLSCLQTVTGMLEAANDAADAVSYLPV